VHRKHAGFAPAKISARTLRRLMGGKNRLKAEREAGLILISRLRTDLDLTGIITNKA